MTIDRIIVVDTETSGFSVEEGAALLEVAWVVLAPTIAIDLTRRWEIISAESRLVEYDGVIPPDARAVHHISPEMVRPGSSAVTRDTVIGELLAQVTETTVFAAHSAEFDKAFLPELKNPWICTWHSALHLYPDAPSHKNQVLRYFLEVEPPASLTEGLVPHRALYDAAVTSAVLLHMLKKTAPEEILRLTTAPVLLETIRFGKHKGRKWGDLPRDYLAWILRDGNFDNDTIYTVRYHLGLPIVAA